MTTRVSKLARELAPYIIDMVGTGGTGGTPIIVAGGGEGESTPLELTHYSTHYNGSQYTDAGSTWDRTYDNVWVEVDVPTIFGASWTNTTDGGDCKIAVNLAQTYPELPDGLALFTAGTFEISAASNKNNKTCFFALGVNGVRLADSTVQVDFVTAGDVMQASFSWVGIVDDNTTISVFAGSDADNTTLTFHDVNMTVHGYARDYPVYIEGTGQQDGGSGMVVHDLDGPWHQGTLAEAQAPWAITSTQFSTHTSNQNAHHAQDHAFLGNTHDFGTLTPSTFLKAIDDAQVAWALITLEDIDIDAGPGIDITGSTISADVDPTGGLGYNVAAPYQLRLEAPANVSTTSGNDIGTGHSHAAEWTSDGLNNPEVLLGADDTGGLLLSNIEAADQITTPEIAAKNNLFLNPVGYAHMDKVLRSTGYDPGLAGAMINFATGDADIRNLEVSSLIADTFIARAKYANVQGEWWGKSASQTTRPFKIPAAGSSETFYIADIPGLTGFQAFEDDDFLFLPFMEFASTETNTPSFYYVDFSSTKLSDVAAGPAELYSNDFEGNTVGQEPPDWYSTAANAPDSELPDLFTVMDDAGNNTFGTTSTVANTHTNFSGTDHKTLSNYTFTGRFKKTTDNGGIGFTLYSQYWPGGEDGYYRIRQYGGHPTFEAVHHGDAQVSGGVSQSSFTPAINTWYRFKIEIESVTGQVNLRGRFWEDGAQEPATWDIDCWDSSANRYTQGTFGFWNYGTGTKYYDDLLVETTGGSELQSTLSFDTSSYPVGAFLMIVAQIPDDRSGVSLPSGWSSSLYSGSPDNRAVLWRTKASGDDATVNITVTDPTRDMFAGMVSVLNTSGYLYYGILYNEGTFTPPVGWENTTAMAAVNIGVGTGYAAAITNLAGKGNEYYTFDEGYASDSNSKGFFSVIPGGVTSETYTVSKTDTVGDHFTIFLGITGSPADTIGAAIGQAVGQITRVYPDDLEDEEQAYNWITVNNSPGQGITVSADARVVDMGVSGQGYMEVSTVGSSRPWMRSAVWSGVDPLNGTTRTTAIMGNVAGLTGSATPEYGFWAGENDQYIQATDTVFETRNLPQKSYGSDGKLKVTTSSSGTIQYGVDIEAGDIGFTYWSSTGDLRIGAGGAGGYLYWDQSTETLSISGNLTLQPGTQVPWSDVVGPFDDIFNDDVTWDDLGTSRPDDDDLLNARQVWDDVQDLPPLLGYTDVQNPPGGLGAGLYMNAWYMGYWSPVHGWQTYMQNNGNFMFRSAGSTNNRLEWDGTKLAGYDSGDVTQFYLSATDGKAYAGGGVVQMDADGLRIQNGYGENNRISFYSTTDSNSEFATIRAEGSQTSGFVSFGVNNANQTALRINYDDNATGSTGASFGPLTGYFEIDTPNLTVTGNIQSNAAVIAGGDLRAFSDVSMQNLPTSDPGVAGFLWRSGNDIKISTG